jgi:hypothetical protein
MSELNIWTAWICIALGVLLMIVREILFPSVNRLAGTGCWQRRMVRLGHCSLFAVAFINLAYVNSLYLLGLDPPDLDTSLLFLGGALLMPAVCYLAAWRKRLRLLFVLPAMSVLGAMGLFISAGLLS